ncbi:MAG: YhfC family intramembrane metalloprotease [Anaerolineaceae bacterium]|nr:YhfC family intramembrane metalloprotease [Anaerolineaceae bacterium]
MGIDFWASFQEGSVTISIVNKSSAEIVYEKTYEGTLVNENEVTTLHQGEYDLLVTWDGPIKGNYNLEWHPGKVEIPTISPIVLLPGIGMLLVGMFFFFFAVRQSNAKMAFLGGLFWIGTVIVKFVIAGSFNGYIYQWSEAALPGLPGQLLFSVYVGLLTGITEILITWLILRYTKFGQRIWREILSFSLGFGSLEAILLGTLSLMGMIATLTMTDQIPVAQLRTTALANNFFYDLAPIIERIFTIMIHMGCNVLLFYSVFKKEMRWFWASFALKSGIDTIAGYAQISGQLESVAFIWIIEIFVILFGTMGFLITRKLIPELEMLTAAVGEIIEPD